MPYVEIMFKCFHGLLDRRILRQLSQWDHVGRQARDKHDVENVRDLSHALQQEWARIHLRVIRKLICSMRRCCGAVVAAGGRHTRY